MAQTLQFARNTKMFIEIGSDIWEVPVMDGFSFSQATNASEIVLSEAASQSGISRRGKQVFNDSYAPAEFSFTTYVRPNVGATVPLTGCVEEALWAMFIAANGYTSGSGEWDAGVTKVQNTSAVFDFNDSNVTLLGEFNLWFILGGCGDTDGTYTTGEGATIYKIASSVLDTASIDFDIEGIAQITWGGFGGIITEEATLVATSAIATGINDTANFIRNKITSMTLAPSTQMKTDYSMPDNYTVVLTGGTINFENNITFLTPEELCKVNQPLGHVTGARSISGNFTSYLNSTADATEDLWEDMAAATTMVTSDFALTFSIGGTSTPRMVVTMPQAHLEIPTHSIEDVISLDTTFHALPSDLDTADEATIGYFGV
jgi:hypothetical protein